MQENLLLRVVVMGKGAERDANCRRFRWECSVLWVMASGGFAAGGTLNRVQLDLGVGFVGWVGFSPSTFGFLNGVDVEYQQ